LDHPVSDVCSVIAYIDQEDNQPGSPGDLCAIVLWEDEAPTRIGQIVEDYAYWPAVTAHMAKAGNDAVLVIDIVYENHEGNHIAIHHVRLVQDDQGDLGNFTIGDEEEVDADGSYDLMHPDVVYNYKYEDRLDCVYDRSISGGGKRIDYADWDDSGWSPRGRISDALAAHPVYPRIDTGLIHVADANYLIVFVVWMQFSPPPDFDLDLYWTAWESESNPQPPDEPMGGFIEDPYANCETETSAFPFVDIQPRDLDATNNIAHIVWQQDDQGQDPDVFYVNTHNIDEILGDPEAWDYYPIEDDSDDQGLPQIVAYADGSEEGLIIYVNDDDGRLYSAGIDYGTPSSVTIDNPDALPDGDCDTKMGDPFVHGPGIALCLVDSIWAAWSDTREEQWLIYGNYFTQ
jgi:hypothetical protein